MDKGNGHETQKIKRENALTNNKSSHAIKEKINYWVE